jgi:RNA polymerase sigma-70 factor (ECF subfamily)
VARLDERAFAAFYERTSRAVWLYAYRVTGHAADADDVVQEAFCRVIATDVDVTDDEGLRRYVFRIAGNLMTDRWRRAARERSWLERWRGVAEEPVVDPGYDDSVSHEFAALAPRERALLWLAYVEGENHREIADALGLSRASVKVLLFRARARLRQLLTARGVAARAQ